MAVQEQIQDNGWTPEYILLVSSLLINWNATMSQKAMPGKDCYISHHLMYNCPKNSGFTSDAIYSRYKDLADVEWAFRTMKSDTIELRPIHVRKQPRTRAHVFIAMLSYIIEKHLREKWKDINITVEEGIHELSSINCIAVEVGAVKYNRIPEPREIGSKLLKALSVTLPKAIPSIGICVSTRKKLELKRKK